MFMSMFTSILMLHEQKMYMGVEVEVDIEKEMDME
jgi:hypothetical protein